MTFLKIPFCDEETGNETVERILINIDRIITIFIPHIIERPTVIVTDSGNFRTFSIKHSEDIKQFIVEI